MRPIRRAIIIVLGLLGALSSVFAVVSLSWWNLENIRILPSKTLHCLQSPCIESNHRWLEPSDAWLRLAAAVDVAAYLLALGCIAVAATAAARRSSTLVNRWTWASAAVALLTTVAFLALAPTLTAGHAGWGAVALIGAAVIATIGAALSRNQAAGPSSPVT